MAKEYKINDTKYSTSLSISFSGPHLTIILYNPNTSYKLNHLDVLPSNRGASVDRDSQSIEAEAVTNLASGDSSVLQSSKNLPLRGSSAPAGTAGAGGTVGGTVGSRASHEARCTQAIEGPVAERGTGSVDEGTIRGTNGLVGRVGRCEAQSTLVINVDSLATGDLDILDMKLANGALEIYMYQYF